MRSEIIEFVSKNCGRLGLRAEFEHSNRSESEYINVYTKDEDGDEESHTVRISEHKRPAVMDGDIAYDWEYDLELLDYDLDNEFTMLLVLDMLDLWLGDMELEKRELIEKGKQMIFATYPDSWSDDIRFGNNDCVRNKFLKEQIENKIANA